MDLVKAAIFGAVGWLGYEYILKPAMATPAPAAIPAGAPPASTTPPVSTDPPAPGAVASFNSLDAIFARVQAATGGATQTADSFNWYLARELPAGITAPDPVLVFGAGGNWDRNIPMTLANYWGLMAPYLRTNLGLSGLGCFGGLGALARRAR